MQYKLGEIVKGRVTGVQPYGAFVSLDHENSGLIHISEISSGFIKNVCNVFKVGDIVEAKIIDLDEEHHHYKLSIKSLKQNSTRHRQRIQRKEKLPTMNLGFKTLADHLDEWIKIANASEDMNDD